MDSSYLMRPGHLRPNAPFTLPSGGQTSLLNFQAANDISKSGFVPPGVNYFKPVGAPASGIKLTPSIPGVTSVVYRISDTGDVVTKQDNSRKRKLDTSDTGSSSLSDKLTNGMDAAKKIKMSESISKNDALIANLDRSIEASSSNSKLQPHVTPKDCVVSKEFDPDSESSPTKGLTDPSGKDDKDANSLKKSQKMWKQLRDDSDDESEMGSKKDSTFCSPRSNSDDAPSQSQVDSSSVDVMRTPERYQSLDGDLNMSSSSPSKQVDTGLRKDLTDTIDISLNENVMTTPVSGTDCRTVVKGSVGLTSLQLNGPLRVEMSSDQSCNALSGLCATSNCRQEGAESMELADDSTILHLQAANPSKLIDPEGGNCVKSLAMNTKSMLVDFEKDIPVKMYRVTPDGLVPEMDKRKLSVTFNLDGNIVSNGKIDDDFKKLEIDENLTINDSVVNSVTTGNEAAVIPSADIVKQRRKFYGKFEYVPTGETIFRCLVTKCGQCFDDRRAAEMHSDAHGDIVIDDPNQSISSLRCQSCEFTAPFYHWFDLLRHMSTNHDTVLSRLAHSCNYCGLTFENEERLVSHIDFHYSNRYKCIHCGLLLLTWEQVGLSINKTTYFYCVLKNIYAHIYCLIKSNYAYIYCRIKMNNAHI